MIESTDEQLYLLGFALVAEFGQAKLKKITRHFPSLETAWHTRDAGVFIEAGLSESFSRKLVAHCASTDLTLIKQTLHDLEITPLVLTDPDYPPQLREIPSAPVALFCRGNIALLQKKQIAVVGSRNYTSYGKQVVEKLLPDLGRAGLVVTSGLAQGIDSLAHQTALRHSIPTIAVLGSGVEESLIRHATSYPLAQDILRTDGLLVSEYPPGTSATKFTFPARNRIISGLSLGVLVVEAGQKSGTLITAQWALEQNRDVFAVPGNIFSPQSTGTNTLIRDGAHPARSAGDILEAFHFIVPNADQAQKRATFDDPLMEQIYTVLSCEPLHLDVIAKRITVDSATVATKLSLMELQEVVRNIGGGKFIRN